MGKILLEYEIRPEDPGVDMDKVLQEILSKVSSLKNIEVKNYSVEPFVFGMKMIKIEFVVPEEDEDAQDFLESQIKGVKGVGEIELVYFTRL